MAAGLGVEIGIAMKGCVGALLVLAALASPAWGQRMVDGTDLTGHCDHHPADTEANVSAALSLALCYGFLKGVADAHTVVAAADDTGPLFCPPGGAVKNEEARLVFLDWAHKYPDRLDLPAAVAVTTAFREAYPCKE